ncbi:hypothetical protein X798_04489 [Onchocerca flexuosa]|uniref:Uncharacterized protein n=1 Tax=Onchocerca flexuosa TaxID=387005 RepID=A0A238BST5_9BILA|nr:hypothetical protein X798_04489 [Onchocerca flexuosa]
MKIIIRSLLHILHFFHSPPDYSRWNDINAVKQKGLTCCSLDMSIFKFVIGILAINFIAQKHFKVVAMENEMQCDINIGEMAVAVIHTGNECKDSVKSTAAEVDEKN